MKTNKKWEKYSNGDCYIKGWLIIFFNFFAENAKIVFAQIDKNFEDAEDLVNC